MAWEGLQAHGSAGCRSSAGGVSTRSLSAAGHNDGKEATFAEQAGGPQAGHQNGGLLVSKHHRMLVHNELFCGTVSSCGQPSTCCR